MKKLPYKNSELPIESRVEDLLSRMTRAEKLGQLGQYYKGSFVDDPDAIDAGLRAGRWGSRIAAESAFAGSDGGPKINADDVNEPQRIAVEESRLGIPILVGRDVIYGLSTVYPVPLSQAASFNPELVEQAMMVVAREASAMGLHWTFSPMLDYVRDPRWGRCIESYGEDPYLLSVMGVAAVRGFQGEDPSAPDRLLACAKHFAGYGGSEGGRDYDTTEWSENTLHNMILPPFRAVAEAGVATMMAGFNSLGGTPASAGKALMRDWLKTELGWDGFVVSDWGSIHDLIGHRVAGDGREAARLAFSAGVDMEMTAGHYEQELDALLEAGLIPENWLDDAVARILRAKFRAGLFEHPYIDVAQSEAVQRAPGHTALAEKLAAQSIVLLKNNGGLPLAQNAVHVAVLGPYAQARREHLGSWCVDGRPEDVTTILDGLRVAAPDVEFVTATSTFSDYQLQAARAAELTLLCVGESHQRNGENRSTAGLGLPLDQEALIEMLGQLDIPLVVVDCSSRYLPSPAAERYACAILHAGTLGTEAGTAIARVLTGGVNPSGKLPMTIPRNEGQIPMYYNRKTPGKISCMPEYEGYTETLLTPLYPFGFGLSYTAFELTDVALSAELMEQGTVLTLSATLTNTGDRFGAEVVQLYLQDCVASTTRPERELKGFQRVELQAGERRILTFELHEAMLAFYSATCCWEAEPGRFKVALGMSSLAPWVADFEYKT